MSKIKEISSKFAMKLGLESRPSSGEMPTTPYANVTPESLYKDEFVPTESNEYERMSEETMKYLKNKNRDAKLYLYDISNSLHDLSKNIDLGDFEEAKENIINLSTDLKGLYEILVKKSEFGKSANKK